MQKIGLFHRLILQIQSILESCQQTERACSFLTMLTWKIFNHLICVKLYQLAKNQSTRSFHSLDVVNFRVNTRDWPCTFSTMLNLKLFDQLLFLWICMNTEKMWLCHRFVLEKWLIWRSCNLKGWDHFELYLSNKIFPK